MKMLLNGKKVGTEGREEIIVINPYTHEEIDSVLRKGLSYRKIFMMNLPDVLRNA